MADEFLAFDSYLATIGFFALIDLVLSYRATLFSFGLKAIDS